MLWTIFSNLSITLIISIFNILELSSNSDSAASRNFYREHSGIAYTTIRIKKINSRGKTSILLFWTKFAVDKVRSSKSSVNNNYYVSEWCQRLRWDLSQVQLFVSAVLIHWLVILWHLLTSPSTASEIVSSTWCNGTFHYCCLEEVCEMVILVNNSISSPCQFCWCNNCC